MPGVPWTRSLALSEEDISNRTEGIRAVALMKVDSYYFVFTKQHLCQKETIRVKFWGQQEQLAVFLSNAGMVICWDPGFPPSWKKEGITKEYLLDIARKEREKNEAHS